MGFLYIDHKGVEKTRHSYSAGLEFDACPLKFYLHRIIGWRERDTKAALLFGRAMESAVQYMHENCGEGGVREFSRLWAEHEHNDKLVYTKLEKDWTSLARAGQEMMKLYAIRLPSLPIPLDTRFQREFVKEVFPGDPRLGGIEFFGKLDMIAYTDPHHKLLAHTAWAPEMGMFRPLIVDMKTMGTDFDDSDEGVVAEDVQLRTYAWLTGIQDVAFLWFKKNHHELKKGISVTLLDTLGDFVAGDEAVVAFIHPENGVYIVKNDFEMQEMHKAQGYKTNGTLDTTKAAKQRKLAWLADHAACVADFTLTRQRLQFVAGRVSPQSAIDAGRIAANQIAGIVAAREAGEWINTFGIRYPHDDRRDLYFRAFVRKENKLRDEIFEHSVDDHDFDDDLIEITTEETT